MTPLRRKLPCGRRAPRRRIDLRCLVTPRGGRARRLRLTDISPYGCWLESRRALEEGTRVSLLVELGSGGPRELEAEVMRLSRGQGMGLELVDVDDGLRAELAQLLARLPMAPGAPGQFAFQDGP
ncbi:MAG: PilZ domain-containing protein [Polyangiaceae bacterium]